MTKKLTFLIAAAVMLLTMMATTTMWGQSRTDILNEPFNISGTNAVSSTYNGWAITRCWGGDGSIRLGASSGDKGQIISPALTTLSGDATMTFEVKRYGTDTGSIGISISAGDGSVSGDVSVASSSISADSWTTKTVTITGGSSTTKIKFLMSNKRMYLRNVVIVSSGGGTDPSISANDVNITYDATGGSIAYTVNNPVTGGTISASVTDGNWLTLGEGTTSPISFTCSANEASTARTANVQLTYTYGNSKATVTKDVTVTQAAAPVIYTTIPALFEAATDNATDVTITFGSWVISAVKNSNAYLTDNQGNGLIIYASEHGFQVNDVLTGTASCKLQLYRGSAELTVLTSSTEGLTVTHNGTVTEQNIAINNLGGVNTGALLTYDNLTYNGTALVDANDNTITPYSTLYSYTFVNGKAYNVKGIYLQYNSTKELLPRSADDIEEILPSTPTIVLSESSFDLGDNNTVGEEIARTFIVSQSNLTENITISVSGDGAVNPAIVEKDAEDTQVTWTYTPTEAGDIEATITVASAGAESQTITISGSAIQGITGDCYELITDDQQDWSGFYIFTGYYINNTTYYALTGVSGNLGTTAAVSPIGNKIESNTTTDGYRVQVTSTTNGYSLFMEGVGYLKYNSDATSNNLYTSTDFEDETCEWTFSISNNLVTLANVGNTDRKLQFNYNSGNSRFACYTSNQVKLNVFKYTGTVILPPSITASNIEIAYDATGGSIAYTVENPVQGGQVTAATTSTWLTLSNNFASPIAFTCDANEAGERTATVTLTYTYGTKATVDKEVTVTQAANPNVFDNISSITNTDVNYKVKGTVLAVSARAFVLGDGTGYVYYYNGYTAPSVAVNDLKSVNGTMSSYGHVFQFTNAASITAAETSNYNGTPAATVITSIPDYTSGLHLSDYYQFDGTLTKSSGYYYVSCGEGNINISYPSSDQQTAMNALENKDVRVKGYFAGINSSSYFTVILESIEEIVTPTISITPTTANPFTYVQGAGPSDDQVFEVAGENLTSDDIVATITTGADYFEITDNVEYSSTVTVNSGDYISIRLKAGLAIGNDYAGVLTLTNDGAQNVTMNLSGSVTGATYTINLDDQVVGGTIEADKTSAAEGETVTLTAHPDAAYTFGSWTVYQDDLSTEVTVTDDQFTMPACEVYVTATFSAKPTYAVDCVVSPVEGGEMEASPASAYEGQTVTLSYTAETGYSLSGIVITKTEDGSATGITPAASGDDFTFTMPGYAVTATATFISETYNGSFVLFTEEMTEGDYVLVYEGQAMTNTVTSNKFDVTDVIPSGSIITDPSRNIVWHIAPSTTTGYWTIKNEKVNKYANSSSATSTNVSLVDTPYDGAKWIASGTETHDFRPKINENQSTVRYLRKDSRFGTYASSNGGALTLYKYTELTERTITFHGNGGLYQGNETYTQVVYDGIATNLTANQFTLANSAFTGWALTADGDVEYADGASITVTGSDLNLYAKWETSYTAMVDDQIVGGTVLINGEEIVEVAEGTEMTLTYTANPGYAFSAWNVYKDGEPTTTIDVENNAFTMPAYDVIVSATFDEATTYSLVTNVNQIVSGKHYIIASGSENGTAYAMGNQNENNRSGVAVTIDNSQITETEGVYEFVINTHLNNNDEVEYYTIYDAVTPGYLYAASSSKNYLKTSTTLDNNGKWTIAINNNSATITAQGTNSRNLMRYNPNNNNPIFACYATNTTTGNAPCLYVKDNDVNFEYYGGEVAYPENSLPDGGSITVSAGSVLTVPTGFTNNDPNAFIIQDGGQVIYNGNGTFNATLQNNITGYGNNTAVSDGWYLIASPVDNLPTSAVGTGTYDLFAYDEATAYWWSNTGGHQFYTLTRGQGYLYANSANQLLAYAGTMGATNENIEKQLSYTDAMPNDVRGFNLVGNPFTRNLVLGNMKLGENTLTHFYVMNAQRTGLTSIDNDSYEIKPGEGFFVQATAENQTLEFNPTSKGLEDIKFIKIVAGNENGTDNAYINLSCGNTLRKMNIADLTNVYVMNDDKDFAAARIEELAGTMPVNFEAVEDGEYTITVEAKFIEAHNMHLIDNFTGADIDLMVEPSYTFNATTNDNAERFTLVFDFNNYTGCNENYTSENFIYQNGDEIIVNGEGELQVFDVLGRFVMSQNVSGVERISKPAQTGVYIFMMNGKTQKIVVK